MEPNNSKDDAKENKKTIVFNDEEKPKILDNLKEIQNLSVDKLEEKISQKLFIIF